MYHLRDLKQRCENNKKLAVAGSVSTLLVEQINLFYQKFEDPKTKTEIQNYLENKDKEIMRQEDDYFCVDLLPQKKDLLRVSLKPAPKRKMGRS